MKKHCVDGRGLDCPRPLLKTKEAIETLDFEVIEVLVDNLTAKENVSRFLNHMGADGVQASEADQDGSIRITARIQGHGKEQPASPSPLPPGKKVLLIASSTLGQGNEELGSRLLRAYLYTLSQLDTSPPGYIIFMNRGVTLPLKDSESLEALQSLAKGGTEVLSCGACLDYYDVTEKLGVGAITNMHEIATLLQNSEGVINFS